MTLLERAIDAKLDDQEDFVNWWRENVSVNHGGKRRGVQESGSVFLKRDDAEQLTGITQPQVSKWAKRLAKRDEYRAALYATIWKKAMGELPAASLEAVCVATPAAPAPRNSP